MMNRRGALAAMAAATFGAVPSGAALVRLLQSGQAQTQGAASGNPASGNLTKDPVKDAIDERLRQDLARLAPRANSEEGVPVLLACEDLVVDKPSQKSTVTLTAFNAALASDFRKTSEAWQRIHPDAADTDVAKLIEVLAVRDFANGGTEQKQ